MISVQELLLLLLPLLLPILLTLLLLLFRPPPTSSFTYEATFVNVPHATINFPNSDQTISYFYDATYQIVNNGDTALIRNNNILVVGNEPPSGELQFSHFNFTFFQQPTLITMTNAERLKLDNLIKYNY